MNRKKRNLKYIREKNKLRLGGYLVDYIKVSDEIFNSNSLRDYLMNVFSTSVNHLSKMYKFNLIVNHFDAGVDNYDVLTGITKIKFKIVKIK